MTSIFNALFILKWYPSSNFKKKSFNLYKVTKNYWGLKKLCTLFYLIPNFQIYCKALGIKTAWFCCRKNKKTTKQCVVPSLLPFWSVQLLLHTWWKEEAEPWTCGFRWISFHLWVCVWGRGFPGILYYSSFRQYSVFTESALLDDIQWTTWAHTFYLMWTVALYEP